MYKTKRIILLNRGSIYSASCHHYYVIKTYSVTVYAIFSYDAAEKFVIVVYKEIWSFGIRQIEKINAIQFRLKTYTFYVFE